jgi:ferredoxin
MILYFSGTGNSRYAAQAIGTVTGDAVVSINKLLKKGSRQSLRSEQPFVVVCPTYAWRMPRVVQEFIRETCFEGSRQMYFVLTCGGETNNAMYYARKICKEKDFEFMRFSSVLMPENYIAMFEVPDKDEAEAIIQQATPQILAIGEFIKAGQLLPEEKIRPGGRFMSSVVNPLFYRTFISAKGFYSTAACTGCGKCAGLCPLNNIVVENGKPRWGADCTHCMACICACTFEAIEYNDKSQGKPRYYNTGYRGMNG